ncbi:MAG: hypothetical protein ACHP8B_10845 [Terriglobales bacterium]
MNLDSPAVAAECGLKPPAVRALLHRWRRTWQALESGEDARRAATKAAKAVGSQAQPGAGKPTQRHTCAI